MALCNHKYKKIHSYSNQQIKAQARPSNASYIFMTKPSWSDGRNEGQDIKLRKILSLELDFSE